MRQHDPYPPRSQDNCHECQDAIKSGADMWVEEDKEIDKEGYRDRETPRESQVEVVRVWGGGRFSPGGKRGSTRLLS